MARRAEAGGELPRVDWSRFAGLAAPAYTQIPDDLLDWVMPYLTGAELKVLLYIARRTFGFKKATDAISIEQLCGGIVASDGRRLDFGTGLKRSTVLEALRALREKNLVVAEQQLDAATGSRPTVYALNVSEGRSQEAVPPLLATFSAPGYALADPRVRSGRPPGTPEQTGGVCSGRPPGYAPAYPQKRVNQKTVKQKTGNSNFSNETPPISYVERETHAMIADDLAEHSDAVASVVDGYSVLFHDRVHRRSNGTRAHRLWEASGLAEDGFIALLHEARGITQRRGNIARAATDGSPEGTKNRMPYFFSVVEGLIGAGRPARPDDRPVALAATGD